SAVAADGRARRAVRNATCLSRIGAPHGAGAAIALQCDPIGEQRFREVGGLGVVADHGPASLGELLPENVAVALGPSDTGRIQLELLELEVDELPGLCAGLSKCPEEPVLLLF